ncbi:MAG: ABC transporter permease [Marinisporobacter sp.]|jgi:ribose transport system permease protein|nr:ABC transporter permease [Marinisporobacter sp.]
MTDKVNVIKNNQKEKGESFFKSILSSDKIGLIIALIVMMGTFSILSPHFLTMNNFINILIAASLTGLVAVGESYLLIAGHVDLSPGSVAAFAGVLASIILASGMGMFATFLIVIVVCVLIGWVNGLAINKINIEPFIATLASMSIIRGFAYILCNGRPVFISHETFLKIGVGRIMNVPIPVIILATAFIIFGVILKHTRFGRNVYIIGGNAKAARLAGIDAKKVTIKLYMMNAALAGIGGMLLASRMTSGQPSASLGLEFDAITAAVLGGIAFTGGVGTMFGTVLGVIILQGFNNGLLLLNVPSFWQYVARGLLLFLALSFDYLRNKKRTKGSTR